LIVPLTRQVCTLHNLTRASSVIYKLAFVNVIDCKLGQSINDSTKALTLNCPTAAQFRYTVSKLFIPWNVTLSIPLLLYNLNVVIVSGKTIFFNLPDSGNVTS
jgi:hypothetical protein